MEDLFTRTLKKLDKKWTLLGDACRALDPKGLGGLTLEQLSAAIRGFGAEVGTSKHPIPTLAKRLCRDGRLACLPVLPLRELFLES